MVKDKIAVDCKKAGAYTVMLNGTENANHDETRWKRWFCGIGQVKFQNQTFNIKLLCRGLIKYHGVVHKSIPCVNCGDQRLL